MTIAPRSTSTTKVAIIGAGASGISQIKQLLDAFARDDVKAAGKKVEIVCFERGREVGGVWYVDEEKVKGKNKPYHSAVLPVAGGDDERNGHEAAAGNGTAAGGKEEAKLERLAIYPRASDEGDEPSPMYDGLRTNLPHDIMAFRDLPAPSQDPSAPPLSSPYLFDQTPSPSASSASSSSSSGPATPPDSPVPVRFSSLYPPRREMQSYLELYARTFGLYQYIRFGRTVTRLYTAKGHAESGRRWTVHSRAFRKGADGGQNGEDGERVEEFDYVCVANGHYTDAWTPEVRGLSTFPGQILHSRYYNSPAPFSGKRVLVVGSFASGGDIARLMGVWNMGNASDSVPPVEIHVSCSALTLYSTPKDDPSQPWGRYINYHPLISSVTSSTVNFTDDSTLEGVDAILFATGYVFALPFCKRTDSPWKEDHDAGEELLKGTMEPEEKGETGQWEVNGLRGQGMRTEGMDELLLFKKGDRSLAFPGLAYQVVPFPMVECQARLTSLLWSSALDLPSPGSPSLVLPHNPSNPTSPLPPRRPSTAHAPDEVDGDAQKAASHAGEGADTNGSTGTDKSAEPAEEGTEKKPVRGAFAKRGQFVFNTPYEWEYSDHLMRLMLPAGSGKEGQDVRECWKRTEGWRRERRGDKELRKRILGF